MATNRYAHFDSTTGELLGVITQSREGWSGDYPVPTGTRLQYLNETVIDYETHYYVIGVGDPVLTARPVIGMGSDATLTGDGSAQTVATSLPSGTVVYKDLVRLGTYSGTFTWSPTSPDDDGPHRFEFDPPFPDARETIIITVEAP